MSQLDQLMQALSEQNKLYALERESLNESSLKQQSYNTRQTRGLIPRIGETIFDTIRKKQTQPEHRATLESALSAASGVDELQRQIEQYQAMQQEQEANATRAEAEGLYQQYGMNPAEAALRARGMDIPAGQKPTNQMQNYQYAQSLEPDARNEFSRYRGGQNINIGGESLEDATAKKRNMLAIDANEEIYKQGAEARKLIPNYNLGLELLNRVETGPFTEKLNHAKKVFGTLGFDVDMSDVANFEQLSPIFGRFLFEGIQKTKGSVSNKETDIFKKMNANYDYTTEGNRRLLMFAKSRAERDVALRGLISDMRQKGASPAEIAQATDRYVEDNDLSDMLISLIGDTGIHVGRFTVEVE